MLKRLPNDFKYISALVLSYLIWSASSPIIKLTLDHIPPFTFLFLRFLIVGIVLLPYVYFLLKKETVNFKDFWKIFILGVFAQTSIIFIYLGLKYTSVLEATLIGMLGPILSVAAGHYFYKEKIGLKVKAGLLIASLGTFYVALEPMLQAKEMTHAVELRLLGNLFVVLYSVMFLLYIIWSKISLGQNNNIIKKTLHFIHIKPMSKRYSPPLLITLTFYVGLLSTIPMSILELKGVFGEVYFNYAQVSWQGVAGLLK